VSHGDDRGSHTLQKENALNTTARILLVGLGMAWACLPSSAAAAPWSIPRAWLSAPVVRQADGDEERDLHAEARDLLDRARQAMKDGDLDIADKLVREAEELDVSYNPLHLGDTPKKARRDVERLKKRKSGQKETLADRFKFFGKDDEEPSEAVEDPFATAVPQDEQAEEPTPSPRAATPKSQSAPALDEPFSSAPADQRLPRTAAASPEQARAKKLLFDARRAMAYGDMNRAKALTEQAAAMKLTYELTDDSPAKLQSTWTRLNELQQRDANSRNTEAYRREYATLILEQAEAMLQWSDLDEAERLCGVASQQQVNYGPFDVKPDTLMQRITAARTGKINVGGLEGLTSEPPKLLPIGAGTPIAGDPSNKQQVADLMRQSRAALQANDLETAERLAVQAEGVRLPENAFAPGEDQPWMLRLDVQKARMEKARNVAAPAVYDSTADGTRNVAVQATSPFDEATPTLAPDALPGTEPSGVNLPTPPGEGPGFALFQQGEEALRARDVPRAAQLFRQAAGYKDEFDPLTWQRLQDHLQLLSPSGPGVAGPGNPGQDAAARQQLAARQVAAELARLEAESGRLMESDPRRAREVLVTAGQMVENSGVEPAIREQLLRRVQRSMTQADQYITNNQGRIELLDQNREVKGQIDREAKVKVEVEQKLATLVNDFNRLMDEGRYPEAELVAKQAKELAPDEQVVMQINTQVRQMRRLRTEMDLSDLNERGFVDATTNIRRDAAPFDDEKPFRFGDAKEWAELSARRRSLDPRTKMRSEKDLEIEKKLKTPVSLSFQAKPLAEVIDYLGKVAQVNVYLNPQGLADAGATSDTPVTIDLKSEISLKSALNLILEPLDLTYVIKNDVLNITSHDQKDGSFYPVVYSVADLVIGIPNFVPNSRMGLAGALHDAHGTLGYGGGGAFGGHNPISVVASRDGANANTAINPAILASMGASESMHTGTTQSPTSGGPGGIGGGVQPDFDSLIDLITSTIQPTTWTDVGGTGAIQEYENNLTLVISQTQDVHEEIADLLEQLRRLQDLQVTIEVRFITLSDQFFERIGVDFDFDLDDDGDRPFQTFGISNDDADGTGGNPTRDTQDRDHGPTTTVGLDPTGNFTSDLDVPFTQGHFPLAVPQFGGYAPGAGATLGFAILSDIEARFLMEAAQGDRRSNILQAPKVTLFNGQQAFVSDTSQSPFVISVIPVVGDFAAAQQPVIVVLNEGTHMSVQAVVSSDRRFVRMTVVPFFSQIGDVDTFTFTGETSTTEDSASEGPDDDTTSRNNTRTTTSAGTTVQLPTFSFTTVTTTVSVPDGGTVLLGGIKRMNEGRNEFGVPLLSKVPYVNRLFKNVGIGHETQSLMMMVTPRIIIQEEEEALLGVPQTGAAAQP
jgi:general secretion pathway protein D